MTGIIVLNSTFRVVNIFTKDIGTMMGHKTVVMKSITVDKNFSSGE
jgi:hypothetical protein